MMKTISPLLVATVVLLSLTAAAHAPVAPKGEETTQDAPEGTSYVEFSEWSTAPGEPEAGAPGPYTGPGEDDVPTGWNTWAANEHNQCGNLRLIFGNQDLNRDFQNEEEKVQAQGAFFIQFQAIGEGAQDITRFSFSFGKTQDGIDDNEILNCNTALPDNPLGKGTAGVYIPFYRSDFEQDDGFFIPIETRNVPDGEYAAAVHAYTGDFPNYVEVARAWARADVKNCNGNSLPNQCPDDHPDDVVANDFTMPWPMVLPGDGQQTNGVDGLTIEILEPVLEVDGEQMVNATLNGDPVELEPWDPPPRDRDVLPMNDDGSELEGCHGLPASSLCRHEVYSHGWKWEGQIEEGDIIQVEAIDLNGNKVFKSLFWDGIGGVIDVDFPDIDFNLVSSPQQTIKAGEDLRYDMRIENVGGSDAHVDFWLDLDGSGREDKIGEGPLQAEWMDMSWDHGHPTHLHMTPGQVEDIWVDVLTDEQTPNGTYFLEAILTYPALGDMQERTFMLELTIDGVVVEEEDENETAGEELEESPLPGAVAFGALLMVALVMQRRLHRRR